MYREFLLTSEARILPYFFMGGVILVTHFYLRASPWIIGPSLFISGLMYEAMGFAGGKERISLEEIVGILFVYGCLLYVFLCEKLLRGWARTLTSRRGEKWVKELDYLYLLLGTVGIFGSLNRLETLANHYSGANVYAPSVLASAVVIRCIKTRAEIEGWNKLPETSPSNTT